MLKTKTPTRSQNRLTMGVHLPKKQPSAATSQTDNSTNRSNYILLDHISDAVIFTDLDQHILYLNKKAEQLYSIRPNEVIGRLLRDVIQYEYIGDSREKALQVLQQTGSWQGKVVFTRKDKRKFYLLATVTYARDEMNKPAGMVATLKDITHEELNHQKAIQINAEQQKEINRLMIKIQENERNELGRELHDNINQILAAVKLQLEFGLDHYEEEKCTIERCKTNIEEVIREIRNLSHRLVLPRFAETSLQAELEKTIDNICQQQQVQLDITGLNETLLPDNIKETIYRIAQEQVTNIIRHARAGKAVIKLYNDAQTVHLCIHDDGVGFTRTQTRNGVGITNILNRVESYNGTAQLISSPGKGCRLEVSIPLS